MKEPLGKNPEALFVSTPYYLGAKISQFDYKSCRQTQVSYISIVTICLFNFSKGVFMTRVFTYLPKRLLFIALMFMSSLAVAQPQTCEVQLCQEEVSAIVNSEKSYVFIGEEASETLSTMKEILNLADWNDAAPNMRAVVERADQGYKTALKEVVVAALDKEAPAILEKHHNKVAHDAALKALVANLDAAWNLVSTDALTISVAQERSADEWDLTEAQRSCCQQTGSFTGLNVTGNGIIGGNLRVGGNFSVGGTATFNNVVINGTLTLDGVVVNPSVLTNAFVQGGNSFGTTGTLGLNDANILNIRTSSLTRLSIAAAGAVTVAAPTTGVGLTVNANALSNALVVAGGAGATAETITAGAAQTALAITGNSTTIAPAETITSGFAAQPGLVINGLPANSQTVAGLTVNNAAESNTGGTFPLYLGGTQVNPTTFTGGGGNTFATGTPRMIWAQISAAGVVTAQSGGITNVVAAGAGVYNITYAGFGVAPIAVVTTDVLNTFANVTTGPGVGTLTVTTSLIGLTVTDPTSVVPTNEPFSILIMGLAS